MLIALFTIAFMPFKSYLIATLLCSIPLSHAWLSSISLFDVFDSKSSLARSQHIYFQIITLISPVAQISLKQVIDCNQRSQCFCTAAGSSVCHKLFNTNGGKQTNKPICFTRGSFVKGHFNSKKHQVKLSYTHANHILLPQKLYCYYKLNHRKYTDKKVNR